VRPCRRDIRADMEDHVHMVAHHRVGMQRNSEDVGELEQPILYPLPAMVEGPTRVEVLSTQERTADAAAYTVEEAGLRWIDQLSGVGGHRCRMAGCRLVWCYRVALTRVSMC